jgi:hypothetical protein
MTKVARALVWIPIVALIVLGSRAIAYALAPGPEAIVLQHRAAGPALPVVAGISLALGLGVSALLVWLAWTGVRERHALSGCGGPAPALRPWRLAITAPGCFLASSAAFTGLESYIHERAGLGFHGLSCLLGPVHRNAIPILAALSVLAAALELALRHVLAWARRTLRAYREAPAPLAPRADLPSPRTETFLSAVLAPGLGPRAPPAGQPA